MAPEFVSVAGSSIALMFPGQGSQFVGMASDIISGDAESREIVKQADEILGYPLSEIMDGKRGDELNQTVYTQPAIFLHSMLLWRLIGLKFRLQPLVAAGHSLGEYSALCAAGVLSFEDTLRIVKTRAEGMNNAQPAGACGMAAIIGVQRDRALEIIASVKGSTLEIANYNSPEQYVISGDIDSVDQAVEIASREKRSRVVRLPVSSAFHTDLMSPAKESLSACLDGIRFSAPQFKVIANVNGKTYPDEPEEMKSLLLTQLISPVLWQSCVRKMIEMGARRFIEIGPGKVLSGLLKRIDRSVEVTSVSDLQGIEDLQGVPA